MKAQHRRIRRSEYLGAVVEMLEPRVLLDAFDDSWDDSGYDDGWTDDTPVISDPVDTQPTDTQPSDTQPSDTQPSDTQPSDTQPSDTQPVTSSDNSSDNGDDVDYFSPDVDFPVPTEDNCPTPSAPKAPGKPSAQALSSASVYLSWKAATNACGYKIARADASGSWTIVGTSNTTHFTDTGLTAGTAYTYRIAAFNNVGYSSYSPRTAVTTLDSSDPTLVGRFGHLPGGTAAAPLTFNDADGTSVTLSINGPGTGTLHLNADGFAITLDGTSLGTSFQISTARTGTVGDDGRFELASLTVGDPTDAQDATPLGVLNAGTTDLSGTLTIAGPARQITLGNITGDDTLSIDAGTHTTSATLKLTLGEVTDASLMSGMGIQSLRAINWTAPDNPSLITAPSIKTLNITGLSRANPAPVPGDFQASLLLGESGAPRNKPVLGNAAIAGTVSGDWQLAGPATTITAASVIDWTLALSDTGRQKGTLGSLTLTNSAATSSDVTIDANAINTMLVRGNLFGSAITLRQDAINQTALTTFTVRGTVSQTQLRSSGNIGAVKIGVLDHSLIFAGVQPTLDTLPTSAADFVNPLPAALSRISSVTLTGTSNVAGATVLINSDIAAGTIGRVTLPARALSVVDLDQDNLFGFATHSGQVKHYAGPASLGNYLSGIDSLIA